MHKAALSTMWMQLNQTSVDEFCEAAQGMGFDFVELSHVVTMEQIQQLSARYWPMIRVLHHPCPNVGAVPPLSAPDPNHRTIAIDQTMQTIDWAVRLGATTVVLHLGEVAVDPRWANAVRALWLQGQRIGDRTLIDATLATLLIHRMTAKAPHLEAVMDALDRLIPYAERQGVRLAMESGEYHRSIPSLHEAEALLERYETLGLCIDSGHVTIVERLGGPTLEQWLTLAPARLRALHYHDVNGLRDHLVPGNGTIDWQGIAPLVPPHALPTCEFDWYYRDEDLVAGVTTLAKAGLVMW